MCVEHSKLCPLLVSQAVTHLLYETVVHRLQQSVGPISRRNALEISTVGQRGFHRDQIKLLCSVSAAGRAHGVQRGEHRNIVGYMYIRGGVYLRWAPPIVPHFS